MKKIYFYLLLILLVLVPYKVHASSNVIISCNNKQLTLECNLIASIDEANIVYNRVESTLSIPSSSTVSFTNSANMKSSVTTNHISIRSNSNVSSNNTSLGTLKINLPANSYGTKEIKLTNITFYQDDREVTSIKSANSIVKIASNVNTLESLSIDNCNGCKLNPEFNKDTTVYAVTTTSNKINIKAVASGNATVSGAGEKNLTKERETFNIIVTSESGDTKTYRIIVTKKEVKSQDNSLKSLTIDGGEFEPVLSNNVTTYEATVNRSKVVIKAIANDSKATVVGDGEKNLQVGKNEFTIVVTAEDGSSKSYIIIVNRVSSEQAVSLKSLTIDGKDIGFEEDKLEYTYQVGSDVDSIDIKAEALEKDTKIDIKGDKNLKMGENTVTITVTANENKKVYTIKVMRGEEVESLQLDELTIEGYDLDFDPSVLEYTITIKDEDKLNIKALVNNDDYTVEVVDNENLKDGSSIRIIVTSKDGNTSVYRLNIKKEAIAKEEVTKTPPIEEDINYIPIIMTGLLVILFIIDLILLVKRLKHK